MNFAFIVIVFSAIFSTAQASDFDKSKFCASSNLNRKLMNDRNRMSFTNSGGLIGGGVCWWHSRFQRNALYLVSFAPEKAIPKKEFVNQVVSNPHGRGTIIKKVPAPGSIDDILYRIKKGKEVVEVPGFANMAAFSRHFETEIQKILNNWQIEDGFIYQQWITGLAGSHHVNPEKLQDMMNETYERVKNGEIVYQKIQIEGIVAHAWLIQDMVQTAEGYILYVIDSNYSSIQSHRYRVGQKSLHDTYYGDFVPYTENVNEMKRLERVREKACR